MKEDKILTIIVAIVIIVYLIIQITPVVRTSIEEGKEEIEKFQSQRFIVTLDDYIKSRPDYYFDYEGATYCITIKELLENGLVKEEQAIDNLDNIIEATYINGKYNYQYNIYCEEK